MTRPISWPSRSVRARPRPACAPWTSGGRPACSSMRRMRSAAPGRTSSYVEMVSAAGSSPAATTRGSGCRSAGSAPGPYSLPVLTADPSAATRRRARARRRSRSGRPRAGRGAAPSRAVQPAGARERDHGTEAVAGTGQRRGPPACGLAGSVHGRTVPTGTGLTRRRTGGRERPAEWRWRGAVSAAGAAARAPRRPGRRGRPWRPAARSAVRLEVVQRHGVHAAGAAARRRRPHRPAGTRPGRR